MEKKTTKKVIEYQTDSYQLSDTIVFRRSFQNGQVSSEELDYVGKYPYDKNSGVVTPVYMKSNFLSACSDPFSNDIKKYIEKFPVDPADISLSNIVLFYYAGNVLFDYQFNPIPRYYSCDYIQAEINSDTYDLKKLREHLETRSDVRNLSKISRVAYYNQNEAGNLEEMSFEIIPSAEEYKKLFELVKKNEFWSYRLKDEVTCNSSSKLDWAGIKRFRNEKKEKQAAEESERKLYEKLKKKYS